MLMYGLLNTQLRGVVSKVPAKLDDGVSEGASSRDEYCGGDCCTEASN